MGSRSGRAGASLAERPARAMASSPTTRSARAAQRAESLRSRIESLEEYQRSHESLSGHRAAAIDTELGKMRSQLATMEARNTPASAKAKAAPSTEAPKPDKAIQAAITAAKREAAQTTAADKLRTAQANADAATQAMRSFAHAHANDRTDLDEAGARELNRLTTTLNRSVERVQAAVSAYARATKARGAAALGERIASQRTTIAAIRSAIGGMRQSLQAAEQRTGARARELSRFGRAASPQRLAADRQYQLRLGEQQAVRADLDKAVASLDNQQRILDALTAAQSTGRKRP